MFEGFINLINFFKSRHQFGRWPKHLILPNNLDSFEIFLQRNFDPCLQSRQVIKSTKVKVIFWNPVRNFLSACNVPIHKVQFINNKTAAVDGGRSCKFLDNQLYEHMARWTQTRVLLIMCFLHFSS